MKTMRTPNLMKWLTALLCVVAVGATTARAAADNFYLGDGHNGALSVTTSGTIINTYAALTASVTANATTLTVGTPVGAASSISTGSLVMILQTTGIQPVPASGATTPISLDNKPVGLWELARVASVSGSTVTLTAPLVRGYTAQLAQVIVVPEHTTVTVSSLGSITARRWDGSVGGVVALLAQSTFTHQGEIDVSGLGFRGGSFLIDGSGTTNCSGLDQPYATGAQKGEGIANTRFGATVTGRGNVANGGGGGVCIRSGGGGGAGAGTTDTGAKGQGGLGGNSSDNRPVGGLGGAALHFREPNRLTFGGGGGAGHGQTTAGQPAGSGAGFIFVRAGQLAGAGLFRAEGSPSDAAVEAGSGGGGGGTLHLRFAGTADCDSLNAFGGVGGSTTQSARGPGGGGGGGYIYLQASSGGTCAPDQDSIAGANPGGRRTGSTTDATKGNDGLFTWVQSGYAPFTPVTPVIQTPPNGALLNVSPTVINGTAEANSRLTLELNNGTTTTTYEVTVDASGNWKLESPTLPTLADGTYTVSVRTTNAQGDSSPTVTSTFTVDTTPPAAPVIVTPANGSVFNAATSPTSITGTAEANSTVTVLVGGQTHTVTASSTGTWSVPVSPVLGEGTYTISATARDAAGNVSPAATSTFRVDTTPPAAPVIVTPANNSVFNGANSPTSITGTAEANSTVTVTVGGRTLTTTTTATGTWSVALNPVFGEGTYTISATARDAAGNTGPAATSTFRVDTTPPAAPVIVTPANGSVFNGTNSPTSITGTAEANSTVTVTVGGRTLTATANAQGEWSVALSPAFGEGTYTISATARDAAGNTGPAATSTFRVDTTPPAAPVILTPANGSVFNGANSPTTVTGTAEANSTVTVTVGGRTLTTTASATGTWSVPLSPVFGEGTYTISATARDAAGNTGTAATSTFIVDTTAPVAPVIVTPANGSVFNGANSPTTITGTAEANSTVTVTVGGRTLTTTTTAAGTWSVALNPVFGEGTYTISATARDAAGNTGPAATSTFRVDTTPPAAPVIVTPANGSVFNGTNSPTSITGTAEANSTVTVTVGGRTLTATASATGTWSVALSPAFGEGTYTISATSTDAAGNVSPAATSTFRVDTTAPAAPVIVTPANGSVFNGANSPTSITGTAEANSSVTVTVGGRTLTTTASATGTWSVPLSPVFGEGTYTISATARDAAGNTGTAATSTFIVDTTAPVAPVIVTPANGSVFNGANSPTSITGTAEANSSVTVTVGGRTLTTTTSATGAWSVALSPVFGEGTYTISATATDAAGNVSPAATSTFRVDTTAPAAPVIVTPANGSVLGTPPTAISGTAEANTTLTLELNGVRYDNIPVDAQGNWSVTLSGPPYLADGSYTVTATTRDAAGNVSPTATSTFIVDTTAPAVPVIATPGNNAVLNASPAAISGTAEANTTLTLVLNDGTTSTTYNNIAVDGAGNWSLSSPTLPTLADGRYTVTATTRDAAGNVSPTATSVFTVDTTAPLAPVIVTPANNALLASSPLAISGTAEANTTLTLVINDGTTPTTYDNIAVDASGNWSLTRPRLPILGNGTYTLTATTRDAAGNVSPTATSRFTVDTNAPGAPVIVTPANGALLSTPPLAISGTAEANTTLTLVINNVTYSGIPVDGSGNWSLTRPTLPVLADGVYTVTATTRSAAGVDSPTATSSFTVDTQAPAAPVVVSPADGATTGTQPVITGTAEANTTVTVLIDGIPVGTAPVDASGNWSFTPPTPITPGPHTVAARSEDAAGNISADSAPHAITVVEGGGNAPDTTIVSGPSGSTSGRSATFEFGPGAPGVTYECRLDGGAWTVCTSPVTYDNLSEGEHTFEVRSVDSAGNRDSTPATRTWTVRIDEIDFRGDGFGCSASGGDASLLFLALGSVLALRRRRQA